MRRLVLAAAAVVVLAGCGAQAAMSEDEPEQVTRIDFPTLRDGSRATAIGFVLPQGGYRGSRSDDPEIECVTVISGHGVALECNWDGEGGR